MSASFLVSGVRVATCPGLCPRADETAEAAPTLCKEYGPNGWMEELWSAFKTTILDVAGGCLGIHHKAKNFVSKGALDTIDQSQGQA